jgi:hypothetical protein
MSGEGKTMNRINRITRDDVTAAIGRIDDVTIAEIIGTGATVEELAEAKAWIANDEPLLNAGKPLATGRVREVVDILSEFEPDEEDEGRSRTCRSVLRARPKRRWRRCLWPILRSRRLRAVISGEAPCARRPAAPSTSAARA